MSKGNDATLSISWKVRAVIEQSGFVRPEYACDLANLIIEGITAEFGGGDLYIPKADRLSRNDKIRNEFNGSNTKDICRKHHVSKATVYRITGTKK